jgi:molecular chaperone Hsp33
MFSVPDVLVRAIAQADDLRIVAAVTTAAVREAVERHALGGPAASVIGRAITSGLLLATMTKGEERVTLQLAGDGPLRSVTSDANAAGEVRAYVARPEAELAPLPPGRPRVGDAIGKSGVLTVVRDLGMRELYQGRVSLFSGEVDEDVERYLRESEQVPSALSCEVLLDREGRVLRAAGVLVQALPGGQSDVVGRADAAFRQGALWSILERGEVEARELAELLSPSHPIEFLGEDRPLRFRCTCSQERIYNTLRMLSHQDLDEMIGEGKPATVTCNFCNTTHTVALEELRRIREQLPARSRN